jgi:hypothetical protein
MVAEKYGTCTRESPTGVANHPSRMRNQAHIGYGHAVSVSVVGKYLDN